MKVTTRYLIIALMMGLGLWPAGAVAASRHRDVPQPGEMLQVKLLSPLGTKENREGDRFTVQVLEPAQFRDAFIEGHVVHISRSGRISGRAEMELAFDVLTHTVGPDQPLAAQIEGVSRRDAEVDPEGRVRSASNQRRDVIIAAGATGIGTAVGAIIGGRKGAAIGSAIGAAASATTILATRGPELDFPAGTEMTIRITR
ncbi:MAG: hypothetical protein K1Y36_13700 [Blastocatellia bacterium]|nr:hypothetical protein [Blastocatellia bacterium]